MRRSTRARAGRVGAFLLCAGLLAGAATAAEDGSVTGVTEVIKKEEVAEAGYKQTSDTIEDYSRVVHDEVETLKARVSTLEDDLAKAKASKAEAETPKNGKTKPPRLPLPVVPVVPCRQLSDRSI